MDRYILQRVETAAQSHTYTAYLEDFSDSGAGETDTAATNTVAVTWS